MVEEGGCGVGVRAGFACIAVAKDSIDVFSGDLWGEGWLLVQTRYLVVGCVFSLS